MNPFLMPRAKTARGKVLGALPRTPDQGRSPETPAAFPCASILQNGSPPSRVRYAAQKPRALDRCVPFRRGI